MKGRSHRFAAVVFLSLGLAGTTMRCGGGGSGSPPPPAISVAVTPAGPQSVNLSQTLQFTATVSNTTNTAVTWSMTGAGTLSKSGLYTAPNDLPTSTSVTVTATSQADSSALASVTVALTSNEVVGTPSASSLTTNIGKQIQFTDTVTGTSKDTSLSWSAISGSIAQNGLYTAPSSVPTGGTDKVTATSKADPSKSTSATVTVRPAVTVTLSPSTAQSVKLSQTAQFTATVGNTANTVVTWSVMGAGAISASGLYTAPNDLPSNKSVTVTATSQEDISKSASVTVTLTSNEVVGTPTAQNLTTNTGGQIQFTDTVTGSSKDTSLIWSVNGVQGGNGTVGTISGSGLYTAPATAPNPNSVTVSAASAADPSKSGTVSLTVTGVLGISSVSSSSPTALTPLYVSTTGLNSSQQFSVVLANSSGYSATLTPIRTQSDGTVVLAMPLYIDPTTGNTNSLSASLTISQGSMTSSPVALNIQDIPQNSDYGTNLGDISTAFYNYQQLSMGRMQNGFQAIQATPGNAVDTSAIQADISTQLVNSILARSDVAQIVTMPSAQIGTGTLPDGTPISFNSNSVQMMDRLFAMYLTAIQPDISSAQTQMAHAIRHDQRHQPHRAFATRTGEALVFAAVPRRLRFGQFAPRRNASTPNGISIPSISQILPYLGVVGAGETIAGAIRTDWTTASCGSISCVADRIIASEAGAYAGLLIYGTVVGGIGAISAPAIVAAATTAGLVIGVAAIANDVYKIVTDPNNVLTESNSGGNQSTLSSAISALKSPEGSLVLDTTGQLLGALAGVEGVPPSWGQTIATFLEPSASGAGLAVIQGGALLNSTIQLVATLAPSSTSVASGDQATAENAASQFLAPFPSASQGYGTVNGTTDITNSEGPVLSGLTGIQIVDPTSGTQFSDLADANGNYSVLVSLGNTTINYSDMTIDAYDPITSFNQGFLDILSTASLDLSSLLSNLPFVGPTLSGACVDTDAGDPDSDDPDCD